MQVLSRWLVKSAKKWALFIITLILTLTFYTTGCTAKKAEDAGKKEKKGERTNDVLIVKSPASLAFSGWKGEQELEAAGRVLSRLGIKFAFIEEDELQKEKIPCKILILPDTRCMKPENVKGVERYIDSGGSLFALYMSAYRDQDNRKTNDNNNFQLAELYGADFLSWVKDKPNCEYININGRRIQLGRNQAMLVKPRKDVKVLAEWLKNDGKPQMEAGAASPAVIYNIKTRTIYCGENLFAPENSDSAEVDAYIGELLEILKPGIVKKKISGNEGWIKPALSVPDEIVKAIKPAGQKISVGLKNPLDDVYVVSKGDGRLRASSDLTEIVRTKNGETYKKKADEIFLKPNVFYRLRAVSVEGKKPYIALYDKNKNLIARGEGSVIISDRSGSPLRLMDLKNNLTYNFKAYRGSLEIFPTESGKMLVNNYLTLDEYLAGVVSSEMPASYPPEALKAMAVTARTFAVSLIEQKKHRSEGYDVCDSIHCQVYEGLIKERASSNKAVTDTSGIIAMYNGKPAFTPFHAVCGGFCADSESAWSNSLPYLVGDFDGEGEFSKDLSDEKTFREFIDNPPECYCKNSGRFRWKMSFTMKEMKKLLEESLPVLLNLDSPVNIDGLSDITVSERSKDGRAQTLTIVTSGGTYMIKKDKIRWITTGGKISTSGIPSTFFYITRSEDKNTGEDIITLTGGGWGHGTGLCQEGAKRMAELGKKYDEIVRHYYKGVELK